MKPKKLIREFIAQKLSISEWELIEDKRELNNLYLMKVKEELQEIINSEFSDISEFADLVTICFAFARMNGFDNASLIEEMLRKTALKGEYGNLVLTNLNPNNPSNNIYFDTTPEPLDPYTCELCVGDVVLLEYCDHLGGADVCLIKNKIGDHIGVDLYLAKSKLTGQEFSLHRTNCILLARSGATIKEVWNG